MRQHVDHKSAWLLTGLAFRSAQRIGLHKDGQSDLISPFEAELRRRLWWQILLLDSRAAQLSGFSINPQTQAYFECQRPLNINDCNLWPEMTKLPLDVGSHSTEMVFCLVTYEATLFLASPRSTEPGDETPIDDFRQLLQSKYLSFCDEAVPLHLLAKYLSQSLIAQISIKSLRACNHNNKSQLSTSDRDALFTWNIEVIEYTNKIYSTKSLRRYMWFIHGLFPIESFVHVLMELQHRVQGGLVDRGWNAIDNVYNTFMGTNWIPCSNPNDLLYCAVGRLALKAWQTQAAHRNNLRPLWVTRLEEKQHSADNPTFSSVHENAIKSGGFVERAEDIFQTLDIDWNYWVQSPICN
jgi:Fungal specific transcription factor domain